MRERPGCDLGPLETAASMGRGVYLKGVWRRRQKGDGGWLGFTLEIHKC